MQCWLPIGIIRDSRTFGLVLQGGGTSGVYSAGAVRPLVDAGFCDTFEHVVGASAGAMNAAYFLAGQRDAMRAYYELLNTGKFVNFRRRHKLVDIDYVVDEVMKRGFPLDVPALAARRAKFHIVLTDALAGTMKISSDHGDFSDLFEELRASAALPILYGKAVDVCGGTYVDGDLADKLPVDVALRFGCTDIVVVMTRQFASYRFDKRYRRLSRQLIRNYARNEPPGLRAILPAGDQERLQQNLWRMTHPKDGINFYLLEPTNEDSLVSLATTDWAKLTALGRLGAGDMAKFLHKPLVNRHEELQGFANETTTLARPAEAEVQP